MPISVKCFTGDLGFAVCGLRLDAKLTASPPGAGCKPARSLGSMECMAVDHPPFSRVGCAWSWSGGHSRYLSFGLSGSPALPPRPPFSLQVCDRDTYVTMIQATEILLATCLQPHTGCCGSHVSRTSHPCGSLEITAL